MPLAERSYKAAVENQQDIGSIFEIREPDLPAIRIRQRKVGGGVVNLNTFTH
jgi:hypothetical protein